MNSKEFRASPTLLRNEHPVTALGMPILQPEDLPRIDSMLPCHDVHPNDTAAKESKILVHFFKNDDKFESLYQHAYGSASTSKLLQLAQYSAVCTPDFSLYPEMPLPIQMGQVFKNRWCGAHWQAAGLCVLPTITWADNRSYAFCFDGAPTHSPVVVSTVGCSGSKQQFLAGYDKMLEVLQPEVIVCYGNPFPEMSGNVVCFPYAAFRKKVSA